MTNCIACKRWKLFGEKTCPTHPDFETDRDKAEREERAKWVEAEENFNAMMFVAALRTTAAMNRADLLENAWKNLQRMPETMQQKVYMDIEQRGLMAEEELGETLMMALALARKNRESAL